MLKCVLIECIQHCQNASNKSTEYKYKSGVRSKLVYLTPWKACGPHPKTVFSVNKVSVCGKSQPSLLPVITSFITE